MTRDHNKTTKSGHIFFLGVAVRNGAIGELLSIRGARSGNDDSVGKFSYIYVTRSGGICIKSGQK